MASKGVNELKGELLYLEGCRVALKLHLALSKAHLMLIDLFKEVLEHVEGKKGCEITLIEELLSIWRCISPLKRTFRVKIDCSRRV